MNVLENITSAAASVYANKMRSVLTMLGIIIGISAVIMITSIGQGFQDEVSGIIGAMGAAGLQVEVRFDRPEPPRQSDFLTMESVEFLAAHPDIISIAPLSTRSGRVQLRNPAETSQAVFMGTVPDFRNTQFVDVRLGRWLTNVDVNSAAPIAVIDAGTARRVFGRVDVIGERIRVNFWFGAAEFTVVGVYRSADLGIQFFEMPSMIYIPITTMQNLFNFRTVDTIFMNASDLSRLDQTAIEVNRLLSLKHQNENRYRVNNLMAAVEQVTDILGYITGFVALVAVISLIVGGIGVMNIMLVTVTERTREIGIRKSLGATDGAIQFQFLVEAVILTATGGIIGIAFGYYGGFAIGGLINLSPAVSIPMVITVTLISALVGIIFGVYPARKAAKLDPIEALRYE